MAMRVEGASVIVTGGGEKMRAKSPAQREYNEEQRNALALMILGGGGWEGRKTQETTMCKPEGKLETRKGPKGEQRTVEMKLKKN